MTEAKTSPRQTTGRDRHLDRTMSDPEGMPLVTLLDDAFDEERVARIWRGIAARPGRPRSRALVLAALSPLVAALVAIVFVLVQQRPVAGPLQRSSGALAGVFESHQEARSIAMDDGSRIGLDAGARLEVLHNDERSFVTALHHGSGSFDVKPGGPRRWVVQAGHLRVEVLGTRFHITRSADAITVQVDRGSVLVRSQALSGGERRLTAGQSLTSAPPSAAPPQNTVRQHVAPDGPGKELPAPSSAASERARTPNAPPAPPGFSIDAWLDLADAARRRGDERAAARYLEEIVRRAPAEDPRRGVAALTLARLSSHDDPDRAAAALKESMSSMPEALAEDALARRVEAAALAGREQEAGALAREYLERFPDGHRATDVRRWLTP